MDRGLLVITFCSIEIAGEIPSMESTLGLFKRPKNCRAYDDKLSTYRLCPSANKVSNARLDFPEPESPPKTTILFLGIFTLTF